MATAQTLGETTGRTAVRRLGMTAVDTTVLATRYDIGSGSVEW